MLPQILPKQKFDEFVRFLLSTGHVAAPMARGHQFAFRDVEGPDEIGAIRMDYDITILPPKKYLLPTRETLLEFGSRDPRSVALCESAEERVILGVHPYDLHALSTLDAAMRKPPADPAFVARAERTRIIGMNIRQYANPQQFMADMATTEPPDGSFDLFLTDLGENYFVDVGRPGGQEMVKASGLFRAAAKDDLRAKQTFDAAKADQLVKRLPFHLRYLPDLLNASYDSLLWDAVSRRCFSCGTCTNVCPTCYCFDVQDKLNLDAASGARQRTWDSCQLREFAEVAGGENFRAPRSSRLRHRMFRKGRYILERTGKTGCVGCGRCSNHCVAAISILETFQQLGDDADAQADAQG